MKDSFSFLNELRELKFGNYSDLTMCSFDIASLFTNVSLEETIQTCIDTLYHSDQSAPQISADKFRDLILSATNGVEFSFSDTVYKQIDGVAMGSSLGPILANIFVGFYESKLFNSDDREMPDWCKQYVGDTFSIFCDTETAHAFLDTLNALHPSLKCTCEFENNNKSTFLDMLVHKLDGKFLTSINSKFPFTGLYARFDSYTSTKQKVGLVKCVTNRTRKLSSKQFLVGDLDELRSIFLSNGYPGRLLENLVFENTTVKETFFGAEKCPIYLKFPWIGNVSEAFISKIKLVTEGTFFASKVNCIFSQRTTLPPTPKELLAAYTTSCIISDYKCECDARYLGRTTQRLGERIKQHIPSAIQNKTISFHHQLRRQCCSDSNISCDSVIANYLLCNAHCAASHSDTKLRVHAKCRSLF